MLIGVPKEIKTNENRIALVPAGAEALTAAGHRCFVETGRRTGERLLRTRPTPPSGRRSLPDADDGVGQADMIMKVKEPIAVEWPRMRRGQIDLHLLPLRGRRGADHARVIDSRRDRVAYETVELPAAASCRC